MYRIRFMLKDGREICVVCKEYEFVRSTIINQLVSYSLKGVIGSRPLYLNMEEVIAVIREDAEDFGLREPKIGEPHETADEV